MLARREAAVPLVKYLAFFSASPGFRPLFFCSSQSIVGIHGWGLLPTEYGTWRPDAKSGRRQMKGDGEAQGNSLHNQGSRGMIRPGTLGQLDGTYADRCPHCQNLSSLLPCARVRG